MRKSVETGGDLGRTPHLEAAVMDALWDAGRPLNPAEVRARLQVVDRDLAYTTVKTVLVRLLRKGRVARARTGRAYAYEPVLSREQHLALVMEEVLDGGRDRSSTLAHFIETLSASDRKRLRDLLDGRS